MLKQGNVPSSEALSALVAAHAKPALPQAFKLLQYSVTVPVANMPTADSVVKFLKECLSQEIEEKASDKAQETLAAMHAEGYAITKLIKKVRV